MGGLRRLVLRYVRGAARAQSDQAFFARLRELAHRGMNIGGGGDLATSGERQVLDHVGALGLDAPVILDVGANLGAWSLAARRTVSADARILAFEPSTTARERLAPGGVFAQWFPPAGSPGRMCAYSPWVWPVVSSNRTRPIAPVSPT